MIKRIKIFSLRSLVIYLIFALLVMSTISSTAEAMFISPGIDTAGRIHKFFNKTSDIEKIRSFLESKIVQQRLADFGLTKEEISSRLEQLSPQELHDLAVHIDKIDYGGDALGVIISLLVIAILVIVILKLMGKQVIIK